MCITSQHAHHTRHAHVARLFWMKRTERLVKGNGEHLAAREHKPFLMIIVVPASILSVVAVAQNVAEHPNWPGPGQLYVGTCYQPIDRSADQIDNDIAIMKNAGFEGRQWNESFPFHWGRHLP
jgi:hypothetical protein